MPLNFHLAAIRASAAFEPPQDSGPPEAGVFRLLNRPSWPDTDAPLLAIRLLRAPC